jgi:hypothetical protein
MGLDATSGAASGGGYLGLAALEQSERPVSPAGERARAEGLEDRGGQAGAPAPARGLDRLRFGFEGHPIVVVEGLEAVGECGLVVAQTKL